MTDKPIIEEVVCSFNPEIENWKERGWMPPYVEKNLDRTIRCSTCSIAFSDSMGRPIAMGYCCTHPNCPSRITC